MFENFNGVVLPEDKGRVQFDIPVEKVEVVDINIRNHPAFSRGGSKCLVAKEFIADGDYIGSYGGVIKYYDEEDSKEDWNPYQLQPAPKSTYYVDGETIGNDMRYINDPRGIGKKEANAKFWRSDDKIGSTKIKTRGNKIKETGGFYYCDIYAIKDIQPEEEILVDYGDGYWDMFQTWYNKKNPLACSKCDYRTNKKKNFDSHVHNKEESDEEYECELCNSRYKSTTSLNHHIKTKHNEELCKCDECDFTTDKYYTMKYHTKHEHSDVRWKCFECNIVLSTLSSIRKHKENVHEKIKLKCNLCDAIVTKGSMPTHIKIVHEKKKDIICNICQKRFFQTGGLKQHMESAHEKTRPFVHETKCEQCGVNFPSNQEMKKHRKQFHKNSFKCDLCSYTSHNKKNLKRHTTTEHKKKREREEEENNNDVAFDIEIFIEDEPQRSNAKKHRIDDEGGDE
jgi:hypothetical protein